MITIENLEIQLDVAGGDDEQEFARLFNEFIKRWATELEARQESEREAERAGSLLSPEGEQGLW